MAQRGPYRSVYCAIQDSQEYQSLSTDARLVWWALKFSPHSNVAGIFVLYLDALSRHTGLPRKRVTIAMRELEAERWIVRDGDVVWIRNGLRYEPSYSLEQPEKRKGVMNILASLPRLPILRDFCSYYGLTPDESWPNGGPPGTPSTPARASSGCRPYKEQEQEQEQEQDSAPRGSGDGLAGFTEFWQAYPKERRHERHECETLWRRERLSKRKEQILASLEAWKRSRDWAKPDEEGNPGKFIPWPKKFLAKRRYEDTVEPGTPQQPTLAELLGEP